MKRNSHRLWGALAAVAILGLAAGGPCGWGVSGVAHADEDADTAEAKRRFAAGTDAFSRGDYKSAIAEFQAGYALTRRPDFLLNIAICQRKLGEPEPALESLRDFLEAVPDSPRRPDVEKAIAELEAELGVDAPAPAPPPAAATAEPVPAPMPTDEGEEEVELLSTRRTSSGAATVPAPSRHVSPLLLDSRRDDDRRKDSSSILSSGWLWGTVGAVVVAGVVVALLASSRGPSDGTLGNIDLR